MAAAASSVRLFSSFEFPAGDNFLMPRAQGSATYRKIARNTYAAGKPAAWKPLPLDQTPQCDCSRTQPTVLPFCFPVCLCQTHSKYQCGADCFHREEEIECDAANCGFGVHDCGNRALQQGHAKQVHVFDAADRGHGLQAAEPIAAGKFIIEMVGKIYARSAFKNMVRLCNLLVLNRPPVGSLMFCCCRAPRTQQRLRLDSFWMPERREMRRAS